MHKVLADDSSSEPLGSTVLLIEVVVLLGRKDYQARGLAFEMLYNYYQKPIERYLLTKVNDQEHAVDLCQDTFIRVWTHFQRLETTLPLTVKHLRNWLYKIASDVAIDDFRHNKSKYYQTIPVDEAYTQFAELMVEGEEDRIYDLIWLQETVPELPKQYRESLLAKHYWGYTQKEIATKLGSAESTVSANVSRGKTELRRKYFPVTADLKREEPWSPEQAMRGLIVDGPYYTANHHHDMVIEWEKWKQVKEVMIAGRRFTKEQSRAGSNELVLVHTSDYNDRVLKFYFSPELRGMSSG